MSPPRLLGHQPAHMALAVIKLAKRHLEASIKSGAQPSPTVTEEGWQAFFQRFPKEEFAREDNILAHTTFAQAYEEIVRVSIFSCSVALEKLRLDIRAKGLIPR